MATPPTNQNENMQATPYVTCQTAQIDLSLGVDACEQYVARLHEVPPGFRDDLTSDTPAVETGQEMCCTTVEHNLMFSCL